MKIGLDIIYFVDIDNLRIQWFFFFFLNIFDKLFVKGV